MTNEETNELLQLRTNKPLRIFLTYLTPMMWAISGLSSLTIGATWAMHRYYHMHWFAVILIGIWLLTATALGIALSSVSRYLELVDQRLTDCELHILTHL